MEEFTGIDYRPTFVNGEFFCKCGANLSLDDAVTYTERYDASYTETSFGLAIAHKSDSIMSEACCKKCGQILDYDDVVS